MRHQLLYLIFMPIICFFLSGFSFWQQESTISKDASVTLLPENFTVYVSAKGAGRYACEKYNSKRILPTKNMHSKGLGCYIACYSHNMTSSVYPVANDIYVMSQIRVAGQYDNRICIPEGYENIDISAVKKFKLLCQNLFPDKCSRASCWAGGDTGGWFEEVRESE
jgi:hypothetical protein